MLKLDEDPRCTERSRSHTIKLGSNTKNQSAVVIGAGLPPIPSKLAKIEDGEFIDMSKLLLERLGMTAISLEDDNSKFAKQKHRTVSSILEWVQCFGIYVAVISRAQLERVSDLLGYQALIIQASMEYQGDQWLGYDRIFRLELLPKRKLNGDQ